MTEEKLKRLIVAITVGAVLLIVILSSVMLFGIIKISKEKRAVQELEREIARYEQMIADGENDYDIRSTELWIVRRAWELGYTLKDTVNMG